MPDLHASLARTAWLRRARAALLTRATGRILDVGAGMGPDSVEQRRDAVFDTIVTTFALCRMPDLAAGLADLRSRLHPEGTLLFIEHVVVPGPRGVAQRLAAPSWAQRSAGCRIDRDTIGALRSAGFATIACDRPAPLGRISSGLVVVGVANLHPSALQVSA